MDTNNKDDNDDDKNNNNNNKGDDDNEEEVLKLLPIRLISKVVPGFGRGSKDLGIPTANVSRESMNCQVSFDSLPCGIYWGYARIGDPNTSESTSSSSSLGVVFKAAISIGYNPTYQNKEKTIEPHLIAPSNHPLRHASSCQETQFHDFYGEMIRLSICGYLRPELPFEGLEKLTLAIKKDIADTERLGNEMEEEGIGKEKFWVESREGIHFVE